MPPEAISHVRRNGIPLAPEAAPAGSLLESVLDALLAEQRQDWIAGRRTPVSEWLRQYPALACDPDWATELVYHEFTLRQELGELADWEDYLRQFPQYAVSLERLRLADQITEQSQVTARIGVPHAAQFDDYEILGQVGRGGMGIVLKARQLSLGRVVALKIIRTGEESSEERRRRFSQEAQAVACLQHANIVQIYEVGEAGGQPYLSLEFVEGGSLADRLRGTPLPSRAAASLVEVLARAMNFAHGKGIIHRDLKPSNVLLAGASEAPPERCVPKITDFGLAKRLDGQGDTRTGAVLGTPSYMAPEQAEGTSAATGPRTDVYGLGAILYECLTGRPPFKASTPLETLAQVKDREPAAPSQLNPVVARDLETICLKCLEKDPARRYATAEELADDLGRFLRGEPVRARPVSLLGRVQRWGRRNPLLAGLSLLLVTVVVVGAVGITFLWRRAEGSAAAERASAALAAADRAQAEQNDAEAQRLFAEFVRTGHSPTPRGDAAGSEVQIDLLSRAESHCRSRLARHPDDPVARATLADILAAMARLCADCERMTEGEACLHRAEGVFAGLPMGAAANPDLLTQLVAAYDHLGDLYTRHACAAQAKELYHRAAILSEQLADELSTPALQNPTSLPMQSEWADVLDHTAALYRQAGDADRAAEVFKHLAHQREAVLALLVGPWHEAERIGELCRLSENYLETGDRRAALERARQAATALDDFRPPQIAEPAQRKWRAERLWFVARCLRRADAPIDEALARAEQSRQMFEELVQERVFEQLVQESPVNSVAFGLYKAWEQIGKAHDAADRPDKAAQAWAAGVEVLRNLVQRAPHVDFYRREMSLRCMRLGCYFRDQGKFVEAEQWFLEQERLWPGDARMLREVASELARLAKAAKEDAEGRRYLAESERIARAADAAGQR